MTSTLVALVVMVWTGSVCWAQTEAASAFPAALLAGVDEVAAPGTPGALAVWGPHATVLVAGSGGERLMVPVVACAVLKKGRVVAFAHTGFLDSATMTVGQTRRLLDNLLLWSSGKPEGTKLRIGLIGTSLSQTLKDRGHTVTPLNGEWWTGFDAAAFDVVFVSGPNHTEEAMTALASVLRNGGAVVAAQTAWAWNAEEGQTIVDNRLNRLFAPAGIAWTTGTSGKTGATGLLVAGEKAPDLTLLHAGRAIDAIAGAARGDKSQDEPMRQSAATAVEAARVLPPDDTLLRPRLMILLAEHAKEIDPDPKKPLKASQPLLRVLAAVQTQQLATTPAGEVKAHISAKTFPGAVPTEAARVTREIEINMAVPDWQSTGLYAPPGEVVTIELLASAVSQDLAVRIGCHKDQLWKLDKWERMPDMTDRWPLNRQKVEVASAFGGLVYVEVPKPGRKRSAEHKLSVRISGAVEAPLFVLGTTTPEQWRSDIRSRPAPWAELATDRVILAVPSKNIRDLDDPETLLKFWNTIVDAAADLATIPHTRARPERYVADQQISAGYMHSGYPIMTHLDAAADMVNVDKLRKGTWGLFHELGHNHQNGDWTFDGTGEVTVNLFSLYILENACKVPWIEGHPGMKKRSEQVARYIQAGAKFDKWKSDPFLALQMYAQLVEGFGWDTFKKVFAEYRALNKEQRPRNDADKRDQWMVRFSRTCGKNLGPFFEAWGVPTSAAARDSIKDLPGWMPEDFPPGK